MKLTKFWLSILFAFTIESCHYDPTETPSGTSGTWKTASSAGFTPRFGLAAGAAGGKLYVMGGNTTLGNPHTTNVFEVFDPASNTWSTPQTTGVYTGRRYLSATMVDGKIYFIGGIQADQIPYLALNTVEVFDPLSNAWTTPTMSGSMTARAYHASVVINGKIYVIGGNIRAPSFPNVEVFDPGTNTWTVPVTSGTFIQRYLLTASAVGGKIYVFGGIGVDSSGANALVSQVQVFDPSTGAWSTSVTSGIFTPRSDLSSAVIGGKIYVIGGQGEGGSMLDILEVFDPATNKWSTPAATGTFTARAAFATGVIGNKIYAGGGYSHSAVLNANEIFTPAP